MTRKLVSIDTIRAVRLYPNGIVIEYRDGTFDWFEGEHKDLEEALKDYIIKVSPESSDK